jgi:DUF1009 family protein
LNAADPLAGAGPLAIIAGAGRLPSEVAAELADRGARFVVMPLRGIADGDYSKFQTVPINVLDPAGAITALKAAAARGVVMAGSVHRPGAKLVLRGWQAVWHSEEIRKVVHGGDDNLLRGVIRYLEDNGFPVIGLREAAPKLMAGQGLLCGPSPSALAAADIARGFEILGMLGPADIGQALVIATLRVLAVEAAEGTDGMIRRIATLRRGGLSGRLLRAWRPPLADRTGGVLVKAAKPGQDFRADLPVIGPRTVRLAAAAGLSGIAIEAGAVLIVERQATLTIAEKAGLFIVGVAR